MLVRNIVIMLILVTSTAFAQNYYYSGGALDIPTDPRSVAMGESFTGMKDPLTAMMYNPASLSAEKGVSFFHSRREFFAVSSWNYFNTGIALHSPYGNFGLLYSLFDISNIISNYEHYEKVIGLSYSHLIGENLSLGLSLKTFNMTEHYRTTDVPDYSYEYETISQPILLDIGALYTSSFEQFSFLKEYSVGFSIQNFGTDYIQKVNRKQLPQQEIIALTPKYLRTGISLLLAFNDKEISKLIPLSITISGEYRNLLNATEARENHRDQWGFGTEISLFELVALRGGGFLSPNDGAFGDKWKIALRYGFGICAPFEKIGVNLPFMLNIDYGAIPLNNYDAYSPVELLSLQIHYTNDLF